MVFTSVPPYLDPSNWHQQPNHHHHHHHQQQQPVNGTENPQLQVPPPPPQQQQPSVGAATGPGAAGSIRPNSMADRARLAKLPQPESALKCPRCESTNTKFCYFNNYSLSQPRHFCKTCRRYWTRGGALRNVPVGGGCRRNKRSSKGGSRSKSPVTSERQKVIAGGTTSSSSVPSNSNFNNDIIPHHMAPHHLPQLPFMTSLHHLTDHFGAADMGLNYSGIQAHLGSAGSSGGGTPDMDFQIGSHSGGSSGGGGTILSSSGGADQHWRLQQFPFLAGLDTPAATGLYAMEGETVEAQAGFPHHHHQLRTNNKPTASLVSQLASVKMEENSSSGLNLSRQLLGINPTATGNDQYWGGNAWTDLSSFSSSSTSPLL